MLLRRPFAFLIKHFKFIHFILCIPIFYLLYRSNLILGFITEYLQSTSGVIGSELTSSLFDFKIVVSIAIIIIGSFIVMGLMIFKNKPVTFYFYNLFVYIALSIFYMFAYSIIQKMEVGLVDVRTLKIIQDLSFTAIILQFVSSIMFIIRTTGFDIKKFNFRRDLEDLKIETADSEEIEIDTQFDTDEFKRKFRNFIRNAKYVYVENRMLINLIVLVIIGIVSYLLYNNLGIYSKKYELSVAINTEKFVFNIKNNYLTSENYRGKQITDKSLIVISFDVKSKIGDSKLDLSRFNLEIDGESYKGTNKYNSELIDLGIGYEEQEINSKFTNYILVFEVPTEEYDGTKVLFYKDYNNKKVRIKLEPVVLDNIDDSITNYLGEPISFEGSLLNNSKLVLENIKLEDKFKMEYDYCLTNNECYKSYEYISPSYTGVYDKALLKINGEFYKGEDFENTNIDNIQTLIKTYGSIKYVINNEEKSIYLTDFVSSKKINDGSIFAEVSSELKDASNIVLQFNVRNKQYNYVIK